MKLHNNFELINLRDRFSPIKYQSTKRVAVPEGYISSKPVCIRDGYKEEHVNEHSKKMRETYDVDNIWDNNIYEKKVQATPKNPYIKQIIDDSNLCILQPFHLSTRYTHNKTPKLHLPMNHVKCLCTEASMMKANTKPFSYHKQTIPKYRTKNTVKINTRNLNQPFSFPGIVTPTNNDAIHSMTSLFKDTKYYHTPNNPYAERSSQ